MRALAVLAVLALAGCSAASTDFITGVQKTMVQACGFMPLASTVAAVADAMGTGGAASAGVTVARAICDAVTKSPMMTLHGEGPAGTAAPETPTVEGVVIEGHFVKE